MEHTQREDYYPAFLTVRDRRCVVVGGGRVGAAKAEALASRGARVTVVSPALAPSLAQAARSGAVEHVAREYVRGDLRGAFVAVAATGRRDIDAAVAADARAERCLVNVADAPGLSDFIVPSVARRGPLQIAVSTGGAAPAVARRVRERLEGEFGDEWGAYVALAGEVRSLARARVADPATRRRLAERLAVSDVLERVRRGKAPSAEELLGELLAADEHAGGSAER